VQAARSADAHQLSPRASRFTIVTVSTPRTCGSFVGPSTLRVIRCAPWSPPPGHPEVLFCQVGSFPAVYPVRYSIFVIVAWYVAGWWSVSGATGV
jgi:hypothetical protein